MFLNLDQKKQDHIAIIDNHGVTMTYGELNAFSNNFFSNINKRTLIFILCENSAAPLAAYLVYLTVLSL